MILHEHLAEGFDTLAATILLCKLADRDFAEVALDGIGKEGAIGFSRCERD